MTNEEAVKILKPLTEYSVENGIGTFPMVHTSVQVEALELAIKALEERPHGVWTEHTDYVGDSYYTCSNCGEDWTTIDGTTTDNFMNYCPKCGAKMEVEE